MHREAVPGPIPECAVHCPFAGLAPGLRVPVLERQGPGQNNNNKQNKSHFGNVYPRDGTLIEHWVVSIHELRCSLCCAVRLSRGGVRTGGHGVSCTVSGEHHGP